MLSTIGTIFGVMCASLNFNAEISPITTAEIQSAVIDGREYTHLDYNGDGKLTIADAVGVQRKFEFNCTYGNSMTFDGEDVREIIEENYSDYPIQWEISSIDGAPCREISIETEHITNITVYLDFMETSDTLEIAIDPFTESIYVLN